eukprot:PhM_4_TR11713/c2_g1_i3/m.29531
MAVECVEALGLSHATQLRVLNSQWYAVGTTLLEEAFAPCSAFLDRIPVSIMRWCQVRERIATLHTPDHISDIPYVRVMPGIATVQQTEAPGKSKKTQLVTGTKPAGVEPQTTATTTTTTAETSQPPTPEPMQP